MQKKDYSSAFELMMALSFMAFLCSFFNQLTHVEISISANVNEASGDIGLLTRLDIEDDLDEDDDDEGFGEEEDGVGNNRASFIRNVSKVRSEDGDNDLGANLAVYRMADMATHHHISFRSQIFRLADSGPCRGAFRLGAT